MKKWIPFFSQTGSEICNLIEATGVKPVAIVTNTLKIENIDPRVFKYELYFIPSKPQIIDYMDLFQTFGNREDLLITLHGFMRIMPPEILEKYDMYNLHPGLITKYPELKGKDPQRKAFELKLKSSGCVIHKVTSELDSGSLEVVGKEVSIENLGISDIIEVLKIEGLSCWKQFFTEERINDINSIHR